MNNNISRSCNNSSNNSYRVIGDYSLTKESFICKECGTDFLNRDTLAMHVMENVRDGTCQKAISDLTKETSTGPYTCASDSGEKTERRKCDQNACAAPDHRADPIFLDRISKKTRDALRPNKNCFSPPLSDCAQNLLKTLMNPLTLPGWFPVHQESSPVEPTRTIPVKELRWCTNTCSYNGKILMPLHRSTRVCPEGLTSSEAVRQRMFGRRDLHANDLRKSRVEKWKGTVGRERPTVNWLTYKSLAMLNGQSHLKVEDAVGQMLSVMDQVKLGFHPLSTPIHLGESCSVTSSDNKPDAINSDDTRVDASCQPTSSMTSKCDATSSSWAKNSVLDSKVSEYSEPKKPGKSSPCDTTDTLYKSDFHRDFRSKSTPPRLDSRTKMLNSVSCFHKMDEMKNLCSTGHSGMIQDRNLGSENETKADNNLYGKKWTPLHGRPLQRISRLERPVLGKRTLLGAKRLRRSVHATAPILNRSSLPKSGVDLISNRKSISNSISRTSPPASTNNQMKRLQSENPLHISEYNGSTTEPESTLKGGIRQAFYCSHCQIGFQQKMLFTLHMGLHCVDEPWKCNMCGQYCSGVYEFSAHTLHF
ncbi:hypothetical protein FGIG_02696 [Fasciola gigantica]|uniref:C2H2-type domain-containing protein n=1 Tax=Fasciola gigantica TaxID=46835 RepID=A0A504YEE0_FASGI|nr:hypothetical protein FGIG_02696 [Fasciola gigantica]